MTYRYIKPTADYVAAAFLLLLLSPLMLLLMLLLAIFQKQVIFRQTRVGLGKKSFVLYKFCSMNEQNDALGQPLPDDLRTSPIGHYLRRYSLDELPQLINVLKGEMSLVGPRPLLQRYAHRYTAFEDRRHEVKPGITGLVQVSGRNSLSWEKRFALDVFYIEHQGLLLDLNILCKTLVQVFLPKGVAHENQHPIEPYDD
jgi:lipopolysaccharide/colanic/teichoic acid biosynthesis glycosyltransferase